MVRRLLGGAALALGVGAAIAGRPAPAAPGLDASALAAQVERETDHVTAIELAGWIRDRRPGLRVIDVRTASEYDAYHIPSAERMPIGDVVKLRPRGDETLVLYSEGGAHAAQAWVLLRALGFPRVYFLRGGLLDWTEDVMNPVRGADAERVAALSRYFGGVPRPASAVPARPPTTSGAAVARLRRRGC